jgi:hypothetical protein
MENKELNYKEEIKPLIKIQTEAEISEEFRQKYGELCRKYKRDFCIDTPRIIKVDLPDNPPSVV